jgi:hypothetical protein
MIGLPERRKFEPFRHCARPYIFHLTSCDQFPTGLTDGCVRGLKA